MAKRKMTAAKLENWVLVELYKNPGMTAQGLAEIHRGGEPIRGHYHPIAGAVARLRQKGWICDVAERCPVCGCAQTRGRRNVELFLTPEGIRRVYEILKEAA